jgi:hypothetical protein
MTEIPGPTSQEKRSSHLWFCGKVNWDLNLFSRCNAAMKRPRAVENALNQAMSLHSWASDYADPIDYPLTLLPSFAAKPS